jgi:Domain of unknown function (DUF4283)
VAEFSTVLARNQVISQSPWHFKQDLLGMKALATAPRESDKAECRTQIWVQLHHAPLCRLEKVTFRRLIGEVGELLDPALEGIAKWEKFVRLKVIIDPNSPLCDKIPLLLPGVWYTMNASLEYAYTTQKLDMKWKTVRTEIICWRI